MLVLLGNNANNGAGHAGRQGAGNNRSHTQGNDLPSPFGHHTPHSQENPLTDWFCFFKLSLKIRGHGMKTHHRLIIGDSRAMKEITDESVHLIITSPPYWQLKDYGNGKKLVFLAEYLQGF